MKNKHIDLTEDIINLITNNIEFPNAANKILDSQTPDNELKDDISLAFSLCIDTGFRIGLNTAFSLMQGNLTIDI